MARKRWKFTGCCMWIVSKNLQASLPFALDTVASSEDLSSLASTIEWSLMWRSKPSPLPTWLRRWKREPWVQRLFGRTLKPSQHTYFEIEWTSSLAVTPASPFRLRETEKAQTIPDTCGHTSDNTSRQLDLFGVFSRTSRGTSVSDCKRSSQTWKQIVTKRRGEYLARLKSAHLIAGSESSYLPTPTATTYGSNQGGAAGRTGKVRHSLESIAKRNLWPTPTTQDNPQIGGKDKRRTTLGGAVRDWPTPAANVRDASPRWTKTRNGKQEPEPNLAAAVMTWPTPSARDHKGGYIGGRMRNGKVSLDTLDVAVQHLSNKDQKSGTLNPNWVEWLMGLPTGWTDLGSWATE